METKIFATKNDVPRMDFNLVSKNVMEIMMGLTSIVCCIYLHTLFALLK